MGDLNNQYRYKIQIVKPQAGKNLVKNPIPYYRISDYGSNNGAISLNSVHTRRGPQCIRVVPSSDIVGDIFYGPLPVTSGLAYTFSVDVLGVKGQAMRIYIANNSGTPKATLQFTATGNWQRKSVTWIADETSDTYRVYVSRDPVASADPFWVDGFQFEEGSKATTFIQGWRSGLGYMDNAPEYSWEGERGNSPSLRSQWTRHGGELVDIRDYAGIMKVEGLGMSPFTQVTTPIVTGGVLYQKHIRKARPFAIDVLYKGANIAELQKKRQAILDLLRPDNTPYDQPLVLRIQTIDDKDDEVSDPVDVICIFETSHTSPPNDPTSQRDTLYFTALDGQLLGAFKNGSTLDYKVEFQGDYLLRQDPDGHWTDDNENNWMAGVVGNEVNKIVEAPNGDIYVSGRFGSVKNGETAVPNTGRIARFSKASQMWESLGAQTVGFEEVVLDMAFEPNGNLIIVGGSVQIGVVVRYNVTTGTYTRLGANNINGLIRKVAISPDGTIYIGGIFKTASGNSNCKGVARWSGGTWQPLASGLTGADVMALKFHPNGHLLIGGIFTAAGGLGGANYICYWYNGAFHAFGQFGVVPPNNTVYAIDVTPDGTIVIGGEFTNAGGDPNGNYIAKWNGANWQSIGGAGADDMVRKVYCAKDGAIYIAGEFTKIGDLSTTGKVAFYKNGAWQTLDISLPVGAYVQTTLLATDGSLYIGGNFTGMVTAPNPKELEYKTTANSGSANTYPLIEVNGPGRLEAITNHTTGRTIRFNDLALLEGEKLFFHLDPTNLKISSSWEGRGSVWKYLNAGSDIGDWYIQPGKNSIGVFIPEGFDVNETKAYIQWFPKYWGLEGAVHS